MHRNDPISGQILAPNLPVFTALGQPWNHPSVRWPWRVVVSEGPPCSKQHPRTQPKHGLCICVTAPLSAVSTPLSSWPYSKFVFKVGCLQSVTLTKVWFQMDWLASPPLVLTTIPTATQSPQSPRICYPSAHWLPAHSPPVGTSEATCS